MQEYEKDWAWSDGGGLQQICKPQAEETSPLPMLGRAEKSGQILRESLSGMVAHSFNPRTNEAEARGSL